MDDDGGSGLCLYMETFSPHAQRKSGRAGLAGQMEIVNTTMKIARQHKNIYKKSACTVSQQVFVLFR